MGIEYLERTRRLWKEELETSPKKTTITQGKINKLNKFIDRAYAAHSRARVIEEAGREFIEGV